MILLIGLTGLAFAFVVMWRYWPDPDAARPGDVRESDLSAAIDRAIALAAALPDEYSATRVYLTPQGAELAAAL